MKIMRLITVVLAAVVFLMPHTASAGDYMWTWASGSNNANQAGTYGTKGVSGIENIPGAREQSISWKDSAGNLWLFGGWGYDSGSSSGNLNDLWRYDTTGKWTWMSGADTVDQSGIYGIKGTPDPENVPGARDRSISWTDSAGNLWLFGGVGFDSVGDWGDLNDLWRYDATGKWTWMSGSKIVNQSGTYGIKGTLDLENVPGARDSSISWTDSAGNLWLFGGWGFDSVGASDELNDLWRYDTDGNWTWVSGSNTVNQSGTYGAQGTPGIANVPGARDGSISWTDTAGNLWLFGGWGYDSVGDSGHLNDLWRYDATGKWTWMSGANTPDQAGTCGTQGVPAPANAPGARYSSISWIDSVGNLWLFGGWGYDSIGDSNNLNDLWRYDTDGNWTWVSGSNAVNQSGTWGTKGVPDPANVPSSRYNSISWIDSAGNLVLFGGWGRDGIVDQGLLNDVWSYGLQLQLEAEDGCGECPEFYACVDGTCQPVDQPPVFITEPLWVGSWVGLSSDPANPHKPQSKHVLFWAYHDDVLSCRGVTVAWMYRPVELQEGEVVPLGEWVVQIPWRYLWYVWIEEPTIANITGPGLFEFKMTATDCLEQVTDSETFWGKRYYFQVD